MSNSTFRQRMWAQREREIIQAAARLARERGVGSLSMEALADAVGISKPTLYQHFNNKDVLIEAAMRSSLEAFIEELDQQDGKAPLDQLRSLLETLLARAADMDDPIAILLIQDPMRSKHAVPAIAERRREAQQRMVGLVKAAQKDGSVRKNIEPTALVSAFFSLLHALEGPANMESPTDPALLRDQLVDFFIRGIAV